MPPYCGGFRRYRPQSIAQEPVVACAGSRAASEQKILVRTGHDRRAEPEGVWNIRCRPIVQALDQENAVADGQVAATSGIQQDPGRAGGAEANLIDHQYVGL